MALTLPYPDLDFVPLDILTAEEMNEIVANYTYIANQFPIRTSSLDWSTMPYFFHSETSQLIQVATETQLTGMIYTIPTSGKYLVIINGNVNAVDSASAYPRIGVYVDGTRDRYSAFHIKDDLQLSFSCATVVNAAEGQEITARCLGGPVNIFEGFQMIVVRIA